MHFCVEVQFSVPLGMGTPSLTNQDKSAFFFFFNIIRIKYSHFGKFAKGYPFGKKHKSAFKLSVYHHTIICITDEHVCHVIDLPVILSQY